MRHWVFLLAFAFLSPAVHAGAGGDPVSTITTIYKAYQAAPDTAPDVGAVYSPRLQQLIDADRKNTPEGEVGKIDWDVFVDGQEWKIGKLNVTLVSEAADGAQVRAQFNNFDEPKEILFDLVRDGDRWLIDDVQSTTRGKRWTMSKALTGAPDAFPDEPAAPDPGGAAE
jgi:Protein of unknown function (DUF3828)